MTRFNIIALTLAALGLAGFMAPTTRADIYTWTDENGVKHFTNQEPPKYAQLLIKSPEIDSDDRDDRYKGDDNEADDERHHEQRTAEYRLAMARAELLEKEALLLERQLEMERRIAAAAARVESAVQEANQILRDVEEVAESAEYDRWGSYGYDYSYPYYGTSRRAYYSGYYRHNLGLYRKHHYKHKRHHHKYGHHKKYGRHHSKYGHYKKHHRHSGKYGHYSKHGSKRSFYKRHYRTHNVRSHYSLTRGRYSSHSARSAAFRGRHGGRF